MNISKTKLKSIIKEEIVQLLKEGEYNISEPTPRDLMIGNISDMFKEMNGIRPRYNYSEMSDKELVALEADIVAQYQNWGNEERVQDDLDDLYIQSEEELTSYMNFKRAEEEAEAQRQHMMTPEEGEEYPRQAGMGKKLKRRNIRSRMEEVIHEEMSKLLEEMFNDLVTPESGDLYYHVRYPDLDSYSVEVKATDGKKLVSLQALGTGFEPKVKQGQRFKMPLEIFSRVFMEKSDEIDPDTGKRINIINLSESLRHHIDTATPLTENVYRVGSKEYFNIFKEARAAYNNGTYVPLNEEEEEMLKSDLGEWVTINGERIPLDFPMYIETLDEKKKKKKDPPIGKPMKGSGGKKYQVYVRNKKTGRIKKISYGDSKGGLKGNWNNAEARSSFASRHNCAEKKDRTKAGYWACRAHKDFGTNVPGRFW